jgi:hypothetical protein
MSSTLAAASRHSEEFALRFHGDTQRADDGLRPPMNKAQLEKRLKRAQAYLAKFPIPLELDEDVPEILGA